MGIFLFYYDIALGDGSQNAKELKRQIDEESKLKSGKGKLAKATILYNGHGGSRPRKLVGYVVAQSSNGIGVYTEGKGHFIPISQIIEVSFPIK